MTTNVNHQDSNFTNARIALETASIGVLPTNPVWYPLEPNAYKSLGGKYKTKARMPITSARQRRKAVVVDLDASGGIEQDITAANLAALLPGFMFAAYRTKSEVTAAFIYGLFTETGANNFLNGDTITIGTRVYTFQTALTNVDGHILIGGSFAVSAANLVNAINNLGVGSPGTNYFVTQSDPNVTAAVNAANTVIVFTMGQDTLTNVAFSPPATVYTATGTAAGTFGAATLVGGVSVGASNNYLPPFGGTQYVAGDLLWAKGFQNVANNTVPGTLAVVSASTPSSVTVTGPTLVAQTDTGTISRVGFQFAASDLTYVAGGGTGGVDAIRTTTKDLTTLGLIPGEWINIGDDPTANQFATASCNGLARIYDIAAHQISLDKRSFTAASDTGTGKTVRLIFCRVLKNEVGGGTPPTLATGVFTETSSNNFLNNDTVTIAGRVYTFLSALTAGDGHVHVGANFAASAANLVNAINNNGAGTPGVDYNVTLADPSVTAAVVGSTIVLTAIPLSVAANTFANSLTTVYTPSGTAAGAFGAGTLTGGVNGTPGIVFQSYQLERTLGAPVNTQPTALQAEYLIGAVANMLTLDLKHASLATAGLEFMANDHKTFAATSNGGPGPKFGARPALQQVDAFNATSNVARLDLAVVTAGQPNPTSLFAFITDLKVDVKNNVKSNKAVQVLGAFSQTAGFFEVAATATAYFTDVAAIQSVRNNSTVTLDFTFAKFNAGLTVDMPLIVLSDALADVKINEPITLPIKSDAAEADAVNSALTHTLFLGLWDYLPNLAA